jgi:hypothetical protein
MLFKNDFSSAFDHSMVYYFVYLETFLPQVIIAITYVVEKLHKFSSLSHLLSLFGDDD